MIHIFCSYQPLIMFLNVFQYTWINKPTNKFDIVLLCYYITLIGIKHHIKTIEALNIMFTPTICARLSWRFDDVLLKQTKCSEN